MGKFDWLKIRRSIEKLTMTNHSRDAKVFPELFQLFLRKSNTQIKEDFEQFYVTKQEIPVAKKHQK